ncbi:protein kinase [Streptomyces sp. NPDC004658]|uniref:protein kinase domain-containing protein n=1 Tax=Streptomyces sp. NPDC004658 TaxID=3154672 RepID=UPI0033B27AC1
MAGRLNHPNAVRMYDFGSHHGRLHLVMELVDGWSLAQERSLRGALDPQEAAALGAQVPSGLAAAHRQGVIHRDVKPATSLTPWQTQGQGGDQEEGPKDKHGKGGKHKRHGADD